MKVLWAGGLGIRDAGFGGFALWLMLFDSDGFEVLLTAVGF